MHLELEPLPFDSDALADTQHIILSVYCMTSKYSGCPRLQQALADGIYGV